MFRNHFFPTVKSFSGRSATSNKPTAFLTETLKLETVTFNKVVYQIDAYWTTKRNNGKFALAFGRVSIEFYNYGKTTPSWSPAHLSYEELMAAATKQSYVSTWRGVIHHQVSYLYDGQDYWQDKQIEKDVSIVYPQITRYFNNLPDKPPNTDGWKILTKS